MESKISLFVLAAGMGSRYGGLKQMEGFGPNGETIIDYSIYDAVKAGFDKVIFVIRPDMEEDFKDVFMKKYEKKIDIQYVFQSLDMVPDWYTVHPERVRPLGTGHALLMGKDVIKGPFLVINGDDFYGSHSFKISADFLRNECNERQYGITAFRLEKVLSDHGTVTRGICEVKDGYLEKINETFKVAKGESGEITGENSNGDKVFLKNTDLASMNVFCLHSSVFENLEEKFHSFLRNSKDKLEGEFLLPVMLSEMIRNGEVRFKVLEAEDEWFGVTNPEDGPVVRKKIADLIENSIYPSKLEL